MSNLPKTPELLGEIFLTRKDRAALVGAVAGTKPVQGAETEHEISRFRLVISRYTPGGYPVIVIERPAGADSLGVEVWQRVENLPAPIVGGLVARLYMQRVLVPVEITGPSPDLVHDGGEGFTG